MSTALLVAVLSLSIIPYQLITEDCVSLVELNHFFDENGRSVFDQLIYRQWSDADAAFRIVAWRLLKHSHQLPIRDLRRGGYSAIWFDGDYLRVIRHLSFRETWTTYDPELIERDILPREQRRELGRSPRK